MRLNYILQCYSKLPKTFSNFPDRYIRRQTEFVEWEPPKLPHFDHRKKRWRSPRSAYYDKYRPWERDFQNHNAPGAFIPKIYVEPIKNFYMFRGDRVEILEGKDKGKQGIVSYVVSERNWVFVKGLNCQAKIRDRSSDFPGIMIEEEQPLLVPGEVVLVDPADFKPTTIQWRYTEEGQKVRVSVRTGRIVPVPGVAFETVDYKDKKLYLEQPKDTPAKLATEVTFKPKVKTFEMEIMEEMGIKEDRIPYPMFWY